MYTINQKSHNILLIDSYTTENDLESLKKDFFKIITFDLNSDRMLNEKKVIHDFLELGHLSIINKKIYESNKVEEWFEVIHKLIVKSKLTVGHLINQRVQYYDHKECFKVINGNDIDVFTYKDIWHRTIQIGQALSNIELKYNNIVVGIFTENSLRGALIDLSCLSFHFPIVPIPVTTTSEHLEYIINNSEITHLFIGGISVQATLRDSNINQDSLVIYHLEDHLETIIRAKQWESFISKSVEFDEINVLSMFSIFVTFVSLKLYH